MTRGDTHRTHRTTRGRGLIVLAIAALALAAALVGATWNTGASRQSASWYSGAAPDASWVSDPGTDDAASAP